MHDRRTARRARIKPPGPVKPKSAQVKTCKTHHGVRCLPNNAMRQWITAKNRRWSRKKELFYLCLWMIVRRLGSSANGPECVVCSFLKENKRTRQVSNVSDIAMVRNFRLFLYRFWFKNIVRKHTRNVNQQISKQLMSLSAL